MARRPLQNTPPKTHRYKLHQTVRLSPSHAGGHLRNMMVDYEIIRLMPPGAAGELTYRVKAQGYPERAVQEHEIDSSVTQPKSVFNSM